MASRHHSKALRGHRWFASRRNGRLNAQAGRRLRIESLEERQLLAVADASGDALHYQADAGETNDVVLSPGRFFSIQDAPDVAQVGLGGCVASSFLSSLSWSIGAEAGTSVGIGAEVEVGVGVGFGGSLMGINLPEGMIAPSPAHLTSAGNVSDTLQQTFGNVTKGVASVVAGAEVTQAGSVYYNVSASNGVVDEYRLYQSVVSPTSAIQETETAAALNDSFGRAQKITTSTLVKGDFKVHADDVDFYKFDVQVGDRIAVVLDNNALDDGLYANTRLTLYDSLGNELSSNVSFSDGSAVGAVTVTGPVFGPYYVSVADNGFGDGSDYRFVVIRTSSQVQEDIPKPVTFASGTIDAAIPDMGELVSTLPANVADPFAMANSMSVTLNINHTYDGDLAAYLESPSGTIMTLFYRIGGPDDNFTNTTFIDSALTPIADGAAPFTGSFRPTDSLTTHFGTQFINGNWKLHVKDLSGGDIGSLVSWSMTFNVTNNDTPDNADPLTLSQYANGRVSSQFDTDYFKVTDASIQPGSLVFAYVDTYDTDKENTDSRDSYLKVLGTDATTVLGEDDDDGPAVSNSSYDKFNKDLQDVGVDLSLLNSFHGGLTVDLKDGNDRCDASKIILGDHQKITINGGDGNDTILGPAGEDVHLNGGHGSDTYVFNRDSLATVDIEDEGGLNDTLLIQGTSGNDDIAVKMSGASLLVSMNGVVATYTDIASANIENLAIDGGGGDDTITIDCSGGPIVFANSTGVTFEGSAGRLVFTSGSAQVVSNTLNVGPIAGSGMSTIEMAGKTQVVEFTGLTPVLLALITDDVLGPMNIVATDADNAVTLDQGADAGMALLSVDDLAAIELDNKTSLTLDTAAGNDTVHLQTGAGKAFLSPTAELIVNGGSGNDTITAVAGLEAMAVITLDGGAGNDTLQADATLIGGPGDDVLVGGAGADTLNGNDGNDVLIGNGGDNTYDGGAGNDAIVFQGTDANDTLDVRQDSATTLRSTVNGTQRNETFAGVEEVRIEAGEGDDLIGVTVADSLVATPAASLRFTIHGDAPNASDRLVVTDDGLGDVTILRQGPDQRSGTLSVGALAPVVYTGIENVDMVPVTSASDGYGSDGKGRLVVFPTDVLEDNDSRRVATDLEDLLNSHVAATIDPVTAASGVLATDPPADEDWYRFVAPKTGTFSFRLDYQAIGTLANGRAGLPGDGNLKITAYDNSGNPIAKILGEGGTSHTIGVKAGETYYVRVQGALPEALNVYDVDLVDVDVLGPRVTKVSITGKDQYNLFSQKQLNAGNSPTPLVYSLSIQIQDDVLRRPDFLYPALDPAIADNPGHYLLVGDANGAIAVADVQVVNDPVVAGSAATATIYLSFAAPLPDDRYTLTIADEVVDPAGNGLDGETNAVQPRATPQFPSGDGVAGGDFVARFTVDSRPEIGVWTSGSMYVDTNGNFTHDPTNTDASNRDYSYVIGYTTDAIFAGNFARAASDKADGFSKLAAYGKVGTTSRWLIDVNNDGIADIVQTDPANIIGTPVAGNFDGNAANGDEVGLFNGKTWYLDCNHDFKVLSTGDRQVTNGMTGTPIVGDFDGDGRVDLGTYSAGVFYFDLAANGYGITDTSIYINYMNFSGARNKPVAADMDQDGITDIGIWSPDRAGMSPAKVGEWYFLVSNDPAGTLRRTGSVSLLNHSFTLLPPSKDIFARMGSEFAVPVIGNFDPPVLDADGEAVVSTDTVTVSLIGTPGDDVIKVAPGTEPGLWTLSLNGGVQTVQAQSLDLAVQGGGGRDTVVLVAVASNDAIECWPNRAQLVGSGYHMSVQDAQSIIIDARSVDQAVTLHGSLGNDTLIASATTARLSGRGYSSQVLRAHHLVVDNGGNGSDSASLTGTPGNDLFFASLASASLSGDGYAINLSGFRSVRAQAGSGGTDTATLVGSAGNDLLTATAQFTRLLGSKFLFEALGFDLTSVDGGGGKDTATIADAILRRPLRSEAIGTLPAHNRLAVWLSQFSQIYGNKRQSLGTVAVDQVFGLFWT